MASTAEHGFWVVSSILTTLPNKPFEEKFSFTMSNLKKYSPWVPKNWNRELVTRRPVYVSGLDLDIPLFQGRRVYKISDW